MSAHPTDNETWVPWRLIPDYNKGFDVNSIDDSADGLKIVLWTDDAVIEVVFDVVVAYRLTYEGFLFGIVAHACALMEAHKTSLFKIYNSIYIHELLEHAEGQSSFGIEGQKLQHYAFFGGEFIVDVIAVNEPRYTLTWEEKQYVW